jgi:hypothetical protein
MSKRLRLRKNREQVNSESPQQQPTTEEIERLAHRYWLERGSPIGTPEEDWFRAEDEIRRRRQLEHETKD